MRIRKQSNPSKSINLLHSSGRGYYDRSGEAPMRIAKKPSSVSEKRSLIVFCQEIAVTLMRRLQEDVDSRQACKEVTQLLMENLKCSQDRAQAMIDLALELIRFSSYGAYRRSGFEMSLLVARAVGRNDDTGRK